MGIYVGCIIHGYDSNSPHHCSICERDQFKAEIVREVLEAIQVNQNGVLQAITNSIKVNFPE